MKKQFKYIFNSKEVDKEQFIKLAKDSFKWFNNSSINAVDFDSVSNFFSGDYRSDNEIDKHFKGVLDSQSDNYFMSDHFSKVNKEQKVIEDWNKKEFYITPPTKENLEKMCDSFEQRVKNDSDKCGDINYIAPECKSKFGKKETDGKLDYSEINLKILELMAERFNANKDKYPKGNMKKSLNKDSLVWAAFRHIRKMLQPIKGDPETYKEHLAAVLCNMSMILDQEVFENE